VIRNDRDIASWDGSRIMGASLHPRAEVTIRALDRKLWRQR
jgi:hypothetical protein